MVQRSQCSEVRLDEAIGREGFHRMPRPVNSRASNEYIGYIIVILVRRVNYSQTDLCQVMTCYDNS